MRDMAKLKTCSQCRDALPFSHFAKGRAMCKPCAHARYGARSRAYNSAWRVANREKIREKKAAYYAANKDMMIHRLATYRAANRDKLRKSAIAYYHANKETILQKREADRAPLKKLREQERALRLKELPEKKKARANKYARKQCALLGDTYIRNVIRLSVPGVYDIPQRLIAAKRAHVKINRLLKEKLKCLRSKSMK